MNLFQKYLVEEFAEDYQEGHLSRREALNLIFSVTGSMLVTNSILAACAPPPEATLASTAAATALPSSTPQPSATAAPSEPTPTAEPTETAAESAGGTAVETADIEFPGEGGVTLLGTLSVKGPQSALYGRAAFAGAISYTTKDPSEEWEGKTGFDLAEDGLYQVDAAFGGPLTDTLGTRLTGFYYSQDGHYVNSMSGDDVGGSSGRGVAWTAVYRPNDDTKIKFRTEYSTEDYDPLPNVRIGGGWQDGPTISLAPYPSGCALAPPTPTPTPSPTVTPTPTLTATRTPTATPTTVVSGCFVVRATGQSATRVRDCSGRRR